MAHNRGAATKPRAAAPAPPQPAQHHAPPPPPVHAAPAPPPVQSKSTKYYFPNCFD